jgi:hypothetical protein
MARKISLALSGVAALVALFAGVTAVSRIVFAASTFYVRTDGHDTICNGTVDAPVGTFTGTNKPCSFKTIQKGLNTAAIGDTVSVGPGTYTSGQITISKSVTLISQGGPLVTKIVGTAEKGIFLNGISNVRIEGFDISKPTFAGTTNTEAALIGTGTSGAPNLVIKNNILHDPRKWSDPVNTTFDCSHTGAFGVVLNGIAANPASVVKIEDNYVYNIVNNGCIRAASPFRHMTRGFFISGVTGQAAYLAGGGTGRVEVLNNKIGCYGSMTPGCVYGQKSFRPSGMDLIRLRNFYAAGNEIRNLVATDQAIANPLHPTYSVGMQMDDSTSDPSTTPDITGNTIDGVYVAVEDEEQQPTVASNFHITGNTFTNISQNDFLFVHAHGTDACGNNEDLSVPNTVVDPNPVLPVSSGNKFRGGTAFPGNFDCAVCGNNQVEPGEQCDNTAQCDPQNPGQQCVNCQLVPVTAAEVCNGQDDDCDGTVDQDGAGSPLTQACYTGPQGTEGVGICHGGTQTCSNGSYGSCDGEVTPQTELCDNLDNDCDGQVDEGGVCLCETTVTNDAKIKGEAGKPQALVGAKVVMLEKSQVQCAPGEIPYDGTNASVANCCQNLLDSDCVWAIYANLPNPNQPIVMKDPAGKAVVKNGNPGEYAIYEDATNADVGSPSKGTVTGGAQMTAVANTDCAPKKHMQWPLVRTSSNTFDVDTSRQQQITE